MLDLKLAISTLTRLTAHSKKGHGHSLQPVKDTAAEHNDERLYQQGQERLGTIACAKRAVSRSHRNSRFSSGDDKLLEQLKGKGLSWDDISDGFFERSKGALQVHYSNKSEPCSGTSKNAGGLGDLKARSVSNLGMISEHRTPGHRKEM